MPSDPLQIALEHHRAGRLRLAEAGYLSVIGAGEAHAGYSEAAHWLGVLYHQAGRAAEAVAWLQRAAALRPGDAAFQHNLGQALLSANRAGEAVAAFESAAAAGEGRGETWFGLGMARLARGNAGDAAAAADALAAARAAGGDSAELHHHLGVALLLDRRAEEAIAALGAALAKKADYASAYHHLAAAYRVKGDLKAVRKNLIKALELEPTLARAWCDLATLDAEAGNWGVAASLFRKAIAAMPDYAAAHRGLGRALRQAGRADEAAAALGRADQLASGARGGRGSAAGGKAGEADAAESVAELERKLTAPAAADWHHALAAVADVLTPARVPPAAVVNMFDKYAEHFDEHLRDKLGYRVPELIAAAVAAARQSPPAAPVNVWDLGCGTGLCGPLLRPMAKTLVGVDLSTAMIERAKARGVYDGFHVGELVQTMRDHPGAADLLVAADVLIYLGDLAPAFEAALSCLRPGGLFAFSVEAGGGERYHMSQKTRRFTHSDVYLKRLVAMYGYGRQSFARIIVREENGEPVAGYLLVLRAPG